jgi:hypothetical protein
VLPAFVLTTDDFETLIESTVFAGMLRLVLVPVVVTRLALFVALILDLERLLDKVFLTALTLTEVTAFETFDESIFILLDTVLVLVLTSDFGTLAVPLLTSDFVELTELTPVLVLTSALGALAVLTPVLVLTSALGVFAVLTPVLVLTSDFAALAVRTPAPVLTSDFRALAVLTPVPVLTSDFSALAVLTPGLVLTSDF